MKMLVIGSDFTLGAPLTFIEDGKVKNQKTVFDRSDKIIIEEIMEFSPDLVVGIGEHSVTPAVIDFCKEKEIVIKIEEI